MSADERLPMLSGPVRSVLGQLRAAKAPVAVDHLNADAVSACEMAGYLRRWEKIRPEDVAEYADGDCSTIQGKHYHSVADGAVHCTHVEILPEGRAAYDRDREEVRAEAEYERGRRELYEGRRRNEADTTETGQTVGANPAVNRSRRRRGGRPQLTRAEARKRDRLLGQWQRAKDAGIRQKDFCVDQGVSVTYLTTCVNWAAQRRRRSS